MKITEMITKLNAIKDKFGDLPVVGGTLTDDCKLNEIHVLDECGCEIFPRDPNGVKGMTKPTGIFLT